MRSVKRAARLNDIGRCGNISPIGGTHVNLSLSTEAQRIIEERIRRGEYATPEAVVNEALARLEADEPDEQTWAAIDRAEAEFERGEDRPFEEVAAELRQKYKK